MTETVARTCPSCQDRVGTPSCPECGERSPSGRSTAAAGWLASPSLAGLAIGVAAIVLGYRFVLLLITLYSA